MDTATELKFEKVLKSSWHEEVYLTSRRDAVAAAAAFHNKPSRCGSFFPNAATQQRHILNRHGHL
jgi:hypothetical protein